MAVVTTPVFILSIRSLTYSRIITYQILMLVTKATPRIGAVRIYVNSSM